MNERRRAPVGGGGVGRARRVHGLRPVDAAERLRLHPRRPITDYVASTLASNRSALSPTRFHNSVHNAAAGY